ncbi:MAG: radical SAM protein [Magnetococcales bacterium]|nr:radical SAM protein [Magnetococcales bacterium]
MPIPEKLEIRQLDLELNGSCNLQCKMCPQSTGRERNFLKKLPWPVFEKIIDDAMNYGLQSVSLHGSGEPTLNRDMPEMVRYIKERGLQCVSFTNGTKLTETLSKQLIDANIDILRISAVGYDRNSYIQWMSRDEYDLVRENVKQFVRLNKDVGGKSEVHLYHLVADFENSSHEVQKYQKNWVEYTDAMAEIWLMHNWSGGLNAPYDRSRLTASQLRRSCGRPFSPLLQVRAGGIGNHHGAVVACCMVLGKDSQGVLGHLDHQSISDIVSGSKYQELRSAHMEQRFDDISYCRECDQLYNLPESLVWSNIPDRAYGKSKISNDIDHREFTSR